MNYSRLAVALLACLLFGNQPILAAKATGSVPFLGGTIDFKVIGDVAKGRAEAVGAKCTVTINLNETIYKLKITKNELEFKGKKITLKTYKKMEIIGEKIDEKDEIRIVLDGRQVFPPKK